MDIGKDPNIIFNSQLGKTMLKVWIDIKKFRMKCGLILKMFFLNHNNGMI